MTNNETHSPPLYQSPLPYNQSPQNSDSNYRHLAFLPDYIHNDGSIENNRFPPFFFLFTPT